MTYPYTQQYFQFHTSIICMHSDLLNCISVCDMNFKLWIRELIFLGMSCNKFILKAQNFPSFTFYMLKKHSFHISIHFTREI